MAEKLVVWIPQDTSAPAHWLVLDANGNRVGFPQSGALADAAVLGAHRRVIVMLPGEHIIAAGARVPGNNPRRIVQAAPYALEERLAGDVDALHVVLVARGNDQHCDFLVTDRGDFADTLSALHDAGIRPDAVWPDYLGVADMPDAAHWLFTGDERLLGREGWNGFAAPRDDAALLFAHRDSESPLRLTLVGDQRLSAGLDELETARLDSDERAFTELAARVASLPGPGLLQGEFRVQRENGVDWRRWRWSAIAAGVCVLLALTTVVVDAWRLQRERSFLEQATRDLFTQALGNQRMVDPRFQMEQALGSAGSADSRALAYISDVAHALQQLPKARLNGFNYRNDVFEMSVTVPDAGALESLRNALVERAGINVEVQSANSTQEGLEGRLRLSGGAS